MSVTLAALVALALLGVLFAVAAGMERLGSRLHLGLRLRHRAYTLALGVYCSSWTFYGAVGSAVSDGWNYLPIYLAPVVLLLAAPRFVDRLASAVQQERSTTISDFIAARFGHDRGVARIITLIALCGTVPYIALQLRSMGAAISLLSGEDVAVSVMMAAAFLLSIFAILFGARRYEIAGRSEGLVFSIALESLIKLVALAAVGAFAIHTLWQAPAVRFGDAAAVLADRFSPERLSFETAIITLVSAFAVLVLPRQFYMGLVEARSARDLPNARFGLASYLVVMAALIVPIGMAGLVALPAGASPDSFVLMLPASAGSDSLVFLALLGGLSSGGAMVIVDATALATMVSNDLIFPAIMRADGEAQPGDLGQRMLIVRRVTIFGMVWLAFLWAMLVDPARSLASIGLVAFAAMVQFVPHLLLAVAAPGRDARAARASLLTGLLLWLYTLALPPVFPVSWLAVLEGTLFDPTRLLGIGHASPLVHGVVWSLSANLVVLGLTAAGRGRAPRLSRLVLAGRPVGNLGELSALTARFVGEERARSEFPPHQRGEPVSRAAARRAQDLIAGVVGTGSARALVASALAGGRMSLEQVTRLLDEGGQSLSFSRQLLAATFENLQSGISVIDSDLNIVAWNTRYIDLFDYPPGLVRVGVPIADLIRFNVERGGFAGPAEREVEKRLQHLRAGRSYASERERGDGRVIKSVGGPMPGGGYLTAFTDITDDVAVRTELEQTLGALEQRVEDRTRELSEANSRLAAATREKTRFLAAASHDLLQPLHAARLFASALDRNLEGNAKLLAGRVDRSIVAAEDLLRALLDISKLDAGGVQPDIALVDLRPLLEDIAENLRPSAEEKGLTLRTASLSGFVRTDAGLLRSVIQNLVANSVRYTVSGGVVIGVRRRGDALRIDVVDSGVGIPRDRQGDIFAEFTRLGAVEAEGLGLGLAIVERIVNLLGARIEVASQEGRGSRFSVWLPATTGPAVAKAHTRLRSLPAPTGDRKVLQVLVVDNEPDIVDATIALVEGMGHRAIGVSGSADAMAHMAQSDVLLADYHLDGGESGLDLIDRARERNPQIAAALVTAESGADLRNQLQARAIPLFVKPADPAEMAAWLALISTGEIKP